MKKITKNLPNSRTLRGYILFWVGQLFSILGSGISQFTIIWWITETTGSTMFLSLASFFYILPMTIMIALAGVVIDRWNRKTIIVVVDSLQAFCMLIVVLLFNFGIENPIIIIIIMSLLGVFQGFHIPTVNAIIPTMVPEDKLSRMNGVNSFFRSFIQIIGPVVSAMLIAIIPIRIILWIDPITFLIAFIPLMIVKIPKVKLEEHSIKKNSYLEDFKIGFRTLKLIPVVFMMLLISMFINFLLRPFSIFMPYFIKFNHSGTATNLAIVMVFMNGGMLLGSLITSIKKEWKHGHFIYFSGELILMIVYGIMAISPHGYFLLMGVALGILGMVIPIINTIYLTIMQKKVPADKMGRISSIDWAISMAISPIGALIAWPLAEIFGVPNLFLLCSILGVIITIIIWWISHTRINNHNHKEPQKFKDKIEPITSKI